MNNTLLTKLISSFTLLLLCIFSAFSQQAMHEIIQLGKVPHKLALVIGNSDYQGIGQLKNTVNDAKAIAAELEKLGFHVTTGLNLNQREMKTYLRKFGNNLAASEHSIGLFYFGGHGIQLKGENYLIPIGAMIEKEPDIELETISLKRVISEMYNDSMRINFIIIDASRRNAITRLWTGNNDLGLAHFFPDTGFYYMSSTIPNKVTADGNQEKGIYAAVLLRYLAVPNQHFITFLKNIRRDVYTETNKEQIPYDNGETSFDFYFNKTE